jgi:hypothetical protein
VVSSWWYHGTYVPAKGQLPLPHGQLPLLTGSCRYLTGSYRYLTGSYRYLTGSYRYLTGSYRYLKRYRTAPTDRTAPRCYSKSTGTSSGTLSIDIRKMSGKKRTEFGVIGLGEKGGVSHRIVPWKNLSTQPPGTEVPLLCLIEFCSLEPSKNLSFFRIHPRSTTRAQLVVLTSWMDHSCTTILKIYQQNHWSTRLTANQSANIYCLLFDKLN